MSSGFTGGSTRGMSELDREIEYRLGNVKEMDLFTDEFSPPGAQEKVPGANYDKGKAFSDPHTDSSPEADDRFVRSAAAGRADEQKEYDGLDEAEGKFQSRIKKQEDQFPGSQHSCTVIDMRKAMARLNKLSASPGPDEFNKHLEKRLNQNPEQEE